MTLMAQATVMNSCAVGMFILLVGACEENRYFPQEDRAADRLIAKNTLGRLISQVYILQERQGKDVPTTNRELYEFLRQRERDDGLVIDSDTNMIIDPWGRPYLLIVEGDKIFGFASRGGDGLWVFGDDPDLIQLLGKGGGNG